MQTAFHDHIASSNKKNLSYDVKRPRFCSTKITLAVCILIELVNQGLILLPKEWLNDWKDIITIALAPGWCKTYLGGDTAEVEADDSVKNQQNMFETLKPDNSGMFLDRFGKEVAW